MPYSIKNKLDWQDYPEKKNFGITSTWIDDNLAAPPVNECGQQSIPRSNIILIRIFPWQPGVISYAHTF